MAGEGGMVGGFDRGDCRLSGFYTFQEIALMILRTIQLYFVSLLGDLGEPFHVRSIISSPVNPYPSLSSDPLGSAPNIVMPPRDHHSDVLRIFQVHTILRTRVPNGVFCGKIPFA